MKNTTHITAVVLALSLSACASVTDGLKSVNQAITPNKSAQASAPAPVAAPADNTQTVQMKFINGAPAQNLTFTVPPTACDPQRYINNYQRDYASAWNDGIHNATIALSASKNSADRGTNAALQAKRLQLPTPLPLRTPSELSKLNHYGQSCNTADEQPLDASALGTNAIQAELNQPTK